MSNVKTHCLLLAFGILSTAITLSAQVPFESNAGLAGARTVAKDSLNDENAVLMRIVGTGRSFVGDLPSLSLDDGLALQWLYFFHSVRDGRTAIVMRTQVLPGVFMGYGRVVDTIDIITDSPLNTGLSHANSPQMTAAIRANATFQAFRTARPATGIELANLSHFPNLPIDNLPAEFPLNAPVWLVTLSDRDDSTAVMICAVSAQTGETICQDLTLPSGAPIDQTVVRSTLTISPNPAGGDAAVTLQLPASVTRIRQRIGLFDAAGCMVMDLTDRFGTDGSAVVDLGGLSAGAYYCVELGDTDHPVFGVIVVR